MNKNIVLVPCYNRAEFLYHTLQHIINAELSDQFHYIFLCDYGFSKDNLQVIEKFPLSKEVVQTGRIKWMLTKQSNNILNGYKIAVERSPELIILIEDDIFISNDFFRWHLEVHKKGEWFCAIATKNNNSIFSVSEDLTEWYASDRGDYQSLGVSFKPHILRELVLPHYNLGYLSNPVKYCMQEFPRSSIGHFFAEQDGLIRRVLEASGFKTVFPHVPRAYHAGFYGKNRNGKYRRKPNLQARIQDVQDNCYSLEAMSRASEKPEYFADSMPVNLVGNQWSGLR